MITLADLPTPALVLDRPRLTRNLARMARRKQELGVRLRPHLKTAKSADVARLAMENGADAVTVSTLAEAAYFLEHGISDITYAVGITPDKLAPAAELMARGARLNLLTDNAAMAAEISRKGHELGCRFSVFIEINSGDDRGGLAPGGEALLAAGRALEEGDGARLMGVLTHAGHSYEAESLDEIRRIAAEERDAVVGAAARLREAGLSCPEVSVGSTPTALYAEEWEGVTEMRPGVYMFMDMFQAGLGVCGTEDIAVWVLASVIGHRPEKNMLLVDAGALALSKDQSLPGFGGVMGPDGKADPRLRVERVSQEHGLIGSDRPIDFAAYPVGARVKILPNHSCITAANHKGYHVIDGGDEVLAFWERCHGWTA